MEYSDTAPIFLKSLSVFFTFSSRQFYQLFIVDNKYLLMNVNVPNKVRSLLYTKFSFTYKKISVHLSHETFLRSFFIRYNDIQIIYT